MKTKYILHGGFTRTDNLENQRFFTECFIDVPQVSNVLIVLFASENDGDMEYYENLCGRLKIFSDKELAFEKADRENFISQVEKADVVFLQGGDTNRVLTALKEYSNLKELLIGKTIIGSSAGAYVLGVLGTSHGEVHMREGLGILPLRVVCHYESDRLPPSNTSLEEIEKSEEDLELILLKDYEHQVFEIEEDLVVDRYAKIIWNYMHLNQELKPMDAIFILGSHDLRVADRAAELYKQGLAPLVICSGGFGTKQRFELTEAEIFSQRLIELDVPKENILLEPNATNTGENITYTQKLLVEKQIEINSFILVQKPYMERRSYATFKKQWAGPEIIVTSPQLTYEEYTNGDIEYKKNFIELMVGDLQRIKEYPKLGFQIEQEIPDEVLEAWRQLVAMGFKKYFIK